MKKLNLLVPGLILCLSSCSEKEDAVPSASSELTAEHSIISLSQKENPESELYSILLSVSKLASAQDFKKQVYDGVAEKFDGDYNVLVQDLLKNPQALANQESNLQQAIEASLIGYNTELYPQIYIPNFEKHQRQKTWTSGDDAVVFVVWNGKETKDDTYLGYAVNENGELEKLDFLVSEQYARENEVWCISYNERMHFESPDPIEVPDKVVLSREDYYQEHIYQIKIPNYGQIEGWPAGDLELQLTAATAAAKVFEGPLAQINKDDIDDGQWYNLSKFLFYWVDEDHGKFLNIHWVEVDAGGDPGTRTFNIPPQNGWPGVSYSYPYSGNDEDLGEQLVQYDDPTTTLFDPGTEYGTGLIKWNMQSLFL